MGAVSPSLARQRHSAARRFRGAEAPLLLLAGALLIALGAGLIAAHVTAFALDESLIRQSATHYTSDLPNSLIHDVNARATNRLYPLILSVAFRLFSGASAVRASHVLSTLLFVSAAAPIYLMARALLSSTRAAVAVALLSVAAPWLALTSALFTENLAYPLFWWTLLAVCGAVWDGSPRRDLIALACIGLLICTRVQFVAVYAGYLLSLLIVCIWRSHTRARTWPRIRDGFVLALRRYPTSLALAAGGAALLLYERAAGGWHVHAEHLLGTYTNVVTRSGVPPNLGEGALIELIALALGVGLLPAIVSLAWFAKRMSRPTPERRWVYVAATGVVLCVFLILTVYAQGGYLGALTEERYFFYVVPVLWIGTFAAFEDGRVRARELLVCTLVLAALYAVIPFLSPLTEETAFLAPVESVIGHLIPRRLGDVGLSGMTLQDALALLALAAGAITALVWWRTPRGRRWFTVGVAATAQLVIVGYAFAAIDGRVSGVTGRTGGTLAERAWIDRHAGTTPVAWLQNMSSTASASDPSSPEEDQPRTTLFWNARVGSWAFVPSLGLPPVEWPVSSLPGESGLGVALGDGLLRPQTQASGLREVVGASDSPFLQLAGVPIARSPDGALTLTRVSQPARATWLATGLQPDGTIAAGAPARLFVFSPNVTDASGLVVTLTLGGVRATSSSASTSVSATIGRARAGLVLHGSAAPRELRLAVCFKPHQTAIAGTLGATSTSGGPTGTLLYVSLAAAGVPRGGCR